MMTPMRLSLAAVLGLVLLLATMSVSEGDEANQNCMDAKANTLLVPREMVLQDFEKKLYEFILNRKYATDSWCVDKRVRDTGPWIQGKYYGTHPAVRLYYSPRVMYWLTGDPAYWKVGNVPAKGPREGPIPDGGMILKEMFAPPAALYQELKNAPKYRNNPVAYEQLLTKLITSWTVMIKDRKGSKDGWFWAGPGAAKEGQTIQQAIDGQLDDYSHVLYSGFGLPCLRCHASAEKEFTFSALKNIDGFFPTKALSISVSTTPGEPRPT